MPTLNITQTYATGNVLNKVDLDNICTSLTTFVNSTKLDSSNVQTGGLIGANLANATVTATQLAASVAGSGLTGGAGTALAVNVDNSTLQITSNQLSIKAITPALLPVLNEVSCSTVTTGIANATFQDTGLSISVIATGRPVLLCLQSDGGGSPAEIYCSSVPTAGSGYSGLIRMVRGVTEIGQTRATVMTSGGTTGESYRSTGWTLCDFPAAGTYTYKVQIESSSVGKFVNINCMVLVGIPL